MSQGPTGFRTITIQTVLDPKNAPNVKQYFTYDVDGDVTGIYNVQSAAVVGDPCLLQRFEYATVSGIKNVAKIDWITSGWGVSGMPSWDIAP